MLYDRILLASLIAGTWAFIKLFEELLPDKAMAYLPKPLAMYSVLVFVFAMAIHTVWCALAQRRKGYFKTRFESQEKIPTLQKYPAIDIFVSLHNEEVVIESTIKTLLKLNYPSYKIFLINDHSEDSTKKIIENYQNLFPEKIKVFNRLEDEKRGKAASLNYGMLYTDGELIAVFDADAKIDKDFLLKMLPYLEDESVAGVQSQKRISNYKVNKLTKLQENEYCLDSYFQCGKDVTGGNVELRGNGLIVKRKALNEVGNWNEESLTEDLEISTRFSVNGWKIRFCKEAIVYEQAPVDFSSLIKQRRRWCEGSLRRYLWNILKMFGPGKHPKFLQQFDSLVFLSQFAVPIWLFLDVISEIVRYVRDQETHLTFLMLTSFSVWIITWINATFGIRIYRKFKWGTCAIRAFETNMYFLTLWPTVVLITVRKVLFSRTTGKWHKTEHYNEIDFKQV